MDFDSMQSMFEDELIRNSMKKRLLNWGNLFDKYENKIDDKESDESDEPDGLSFDEDQADAASELKAVSENHSLIRKSLCSEIGVTEEDLKAFEEEINQNSDDVTEKLESPKFKVSEEKETNQKKSLDDWVRSDKNYYAPYPEDDEIFLKLSDSDEIQEKEEIIASPLQNTSSDDDIFDANKTANSFSPRGKNYASNPKPSKFKLKQVQREKVCMISSSQRKILNNMKQDACMEQMKTQTTPHSANKDKRKKNIVTVERLKQKSTSQSQSLPRMRREPVQEADPLNSLSCDKNKSRCLSQKISGKPDSSQRSFEDTKTLVQQHELWKLYQRRKSGQFGSLFIVSNLDEQPTEGNHYKPDLPKEMDQPTMVSKRRFRLKTVNY